MVPALNSYWKWIHVTTVALSSSVLMVSGAASVLYLLRGRYDRRLASAVPRSRRAAAMPAGTAGAVEIDGPRSCPDGGPFAGRQAAVDGHA